MNNAFNKVFQNSIFFSIGTLATKAISFLMLPVCTYFMTDAEYGMASTILSFISTFSLLVLLGLRAAILRFYPTIEDTDKKGRFAGSVFLVILINGAFVVGLSVVLKNLLLHYLFTDMEFFPLVFLGIISLVTEALYYAYQSFLQAEQNGKAYTKNSILYMLIYAGTNLILIIGFRLGALGMVITMFTTPLIMSVYGIIKMRCQNALEFCIDKSILKPMLKYSIPVVPHDISSMLATYVSKIFLNNSISYAATGQYTVSSQISNVLSLVQSSLNLAFHPWFNEQMENGTDGRRNIKSFSIFIFAVYCYASIFIALFSPELLSILTPGAYRDAWKLVPLLTLALVINFIYYSHVLAIFYNVKASKFIAVCSITGSLSNIMLSYFLIARIASWGAAIAYFIARCITAAITVVYSRKVQKVDFGLPKMCIMAAGTALIMAIGLAYGFLNDINEFDLTNIMIKMLVVSIVSAVIFLLKKKTIMTYVWLLLKRKKKRA